VADAFTAAVIAASSLACERICSGKDPENPSSRPQLNGHGFPLKGLPFRASESSSLFSDAHVMSLQRGGAPPGWELVVHSDGKRHISEGSASLLASYLLAACGGHEETRRSMWLLWRRRCQSLPNIHFSPVGRQRFASAILARSGCSRT
jgi:hypothetical protein